MRTLAPNDIHVTQAPEADRYACRRYVFLAGAPKSGTSAIFDHFSSHPEVCPSSVKETYYFLDQNVSPLYNKKNNYTHQGLKGLTAYFEPCEKERAKVNLEATADNIYHQTAILGISCITPQPKIIFVLRKPSDRAYSVFQFAKNNLSIIDNKLSFKEFIEKIRSKEGFNTPFNHVLMQTVEYGKYVQYLESWLEKFHRDNVYVCTFDDYVKDNISFMKKLSGFMEVSERFWDGYNFTKINVSYQVKSQILQRLYVWLAARNLTRSNTIKRLKQIYFALNIRKLPEKSAEDVAVLQELDEFYSTYNKELGERFSIDVSSWG